MESIFESLENLNVSEECFDNIMSIVEEIISETKKFNKKAHQEAIFKERNEGKTYVHLDDGLSKEEIKKYKITHVEKDPHSRIGSRAGVAHSMGSFRKALRSDSPDSAPFEFGDGDTIKTDRAKEVRRVLGRDDKFSNEPVQPSKSHEMAKRYVNYKNAQNEYANYKKRLKDKQ